MVNFFGINLFLFFVVLTFQIQAQNLDKQNKSKEWAQITSIEDLWNNYPEKIRFLFTQISLNTDGLKPVNDALMNGDTIEGCQQLLKYYKNANTSSWLRKKTYRFESHEEKEQAQQLLEDKVTFGVVNAAIPKTKDNGWQWNYTGPEKDDEFGYSLNGHKYFPLFLKGWQETRNEEYVKKFDRVIRDWIIHNPLPEKGDSIYLVLQTSSSEKLDWRDIGEVIWRDLEVGRRFGDAWAQTFFGFQQQERFTPAARLLMLYHIPVQAEYLKQYHKRNHNWTTIEMDGLGLIGLAFPEYKEANEWVKYALKVMEEEINGQVYPDGTQTELSTKTQWVALSRFESLVENFRQAGKEIPQSYLDRVEEMYNYMAYSMRPDGHQPLNNDSDREDLRPRVLKAAKEFNRKDWEYIATNGAKGKKPDALPTTVFPWAGIHVMRNGWDKESHWAFFDTGPFGTGHQHADMLHLSIHAYGRDILVDGGRFTHEDYFSFDPTIWRGYFRSSFSHNVILVDGKGQNYGPLKTNKPLEKGKQYANNSEFDYARGTFSNGFNGVEGKVEHSRSVMYVKDKYWVVVDHINTDRSRRLEVLWHFHPECSVEIENKEVFSNDANKGNLRIVPIGEVSWQLNMVKGQEQPVKQGWYSETYGKKEPNSTAVYSVDVNGNTTCAWLLIPAKGSIPEAKGELMNGQSGTVKISVGGQEMILSIPPMEGEPGIK